MRMSDWSSDVCSSDLVVFFKHGDVKVDNPDGMKRQPFNDQNPNGPLELCTCATCGTPIMLDDKQHRIRVIVPNLMGYGSQIKPPAYHAFFDPARGAPKPSDGRPAHHGDRQRAEEGTSVTVRVGLGGRRSLKTHNPTTT